MQSQILLSLVCSIFETFHGHDAFFCSQIRVKANRQSKHVSRKIASFIHLNKLPLRLISVEKNDMKVKQLSKTKSSKKLKRQISTDGINKAYLGVLTRPRLKVI